MSTRQSQGTTLFTALLALVGIGVVVQLWLLAATVDALLRHEAGTPLHAAIASGVAISKSACPTATQTGSNAQPFHRRTRTGTLGS